MKKGRKKEGKEVRNKQVRNEITRGRSEARKKKKTRMIGTKGEKKEELKEEMENKEGKRIKIGNERKIELFKMNERK